MSPAKVELATLGRVVTVTRLTPLQAAERQERPEATTDKEREKVALPEKLALPEKAALRVR